jgi:hypothetical protein
MNGSAVRIRIKDLTTSLEQDFDYPALQDYGHIYLSSFTIPSAGQYTATGILVAGNRTIDSINFRLQ